MYVGDTMFFEVSDVMRSSVMTQLRCGPVSHNISVSKVFQTLDSTSAKELERGLPTGSRL